MECLTSRRTAAERRLGGRWKYQLPLIHMVRRRRKEAMGETICRRGLLSEGMASTSGRQQGRNRGLCCSVNGSTRSRSTRSRKRSFLSSVMAVGLSCGAHTTSAFSLAGLPSTQSTRTRIGKTGPLSSASTSAVMSPRSSFAGLRVVADVGWAATSPTRTCRGLDGRGMTMGIPKLFRWLTDQYPVISQRLDQGLNEVGS